MPTRIHGVHIPSTVAWELNFGEGRINKRIVEKAENIVHDAIRSLSHNSEVKESKGCNAGCKGEGI